MYFHYRSSALSTAKLVEKYNAKKSTLHFWIQNVQSIRRMELLEMDWNIRRETSITVIKFFFKSMKYKYVEYYHAQNG